MSCEKWLKKVGVFYLEVKRLYGLASYLQIPEGLPRPMEELIIITIIV